MSSKINGATFTSEIGPQSIHYHNTSPEFSSHGNIVKPPSSGTAILYNVPLSSLDSYYSGFYSVQGMIY